MTRGRVGRRVARVGATLGAAIAVALLVPSSVLGHALNPTYTSRLPLAVYLDRRGDRRSGSRSRSCCAGRPRDGRRRDGAARTCRRRAPRRASRDRSRRVGLDRRPGHPRRLERRPTSRRSSCGSTAGSASPSCRRSSGRSGTGSTRSRRSTTSGRGSCDASASTPGTPRGLPGPARSLAGGRRASSSSSGSSSSLGGRPATLFVVLVGYTALTLAMMAQFGRDTWRANGETFTVWFRLLGRLGAVRARPTRTATVRRRPFAAGLLEPGWSPADVALVALGVGSILFDGLSQTQSFFDLFGAPGVGGETLLLAGCLGLHRRGRAARVPGSSASGDRCRAAADRRRLPDRPLPDVPADRRAGHRRRDLRPVPARLGPVRDRVPRADRCVAAAGARVDGPAGRRRGRAHARRLGRPRRTRPLHAPPGI